MSGPPPYVIVSEFLEDQVEKDVSNYLGYISRPFARRFRLLSVDESETGADAKFSWKAKAFYLQFKKPTGLKSVDSVSLPLRPRKNESAMQGIRRFRKGNKLADAPYSLAFCLREKAKTATDYQHNILLSLEKPPHSRAVYVCPTSLTKSEYEQSMSMPGWWRFPWRFTEDPIRFERKHVLVNTMRHMVESSPFLRGHACVVPHAKVRSADHWYSFSVHASDVAFHSPAVVSRAVVRLSDFISEEIAVAVDDEALPPLQETVGKLRETASEWSRDELPSEASDLDWLRAHGRLLRERHGIRQVTLMARQDTGES